MTITKEKNTFIGYWRIIDMSGWDKDDLDMLGEPAHMEFLRNQQGGFQVLAIFGNLDWKLDERKGQRCIEFSWIGDDDGTSVNGRGWALIEDGMLNVNIFEQDGEDFKLVAKKAKRGKQ